MALLIKNVKILGGPDNLPEKTDVFVNGDKISALGNFPTKKADEIIDGQGAYLSPGFIDVNTGSDHYLTLFDYPSQEDFLRQGVTTIIGGMCGSSLAPLFYGGLESVQKWGDIRKINVGWHSLKEFLDIFDKKPLAVNFATLVGHSTIRREIAYEQIRDLTKNELEIFSGILSQSLREGGFGLSTGLGYIHGYRTPYSEIKFLTSITKDYGGVYATHLRNSGAELKNSVAETIKIAQETNVKTLISHFMPFAGTEKEYLSALDGISGLPAELDFNFDVYPFDQSVLPIYTFLPQWAQNGGRDTMLRNIKDEWLRPRIEKDLPDIHPEDFLVAQAPNNGYLVGQNLEDLRKNYNLYSYKSALLKFMMLTDLRSIIFYKNINRNMIKDAIKSKRSFIASNSASFGEAEKGSMLKPEQAVSTFTEFLRLVFEEKIMPPEEAIKKITLEPAKKFNLSSRGAIKEGNFADLVIFREKEIKVVVVNGKIELKDGDLTEGVFPGKVLKHGN